MLVAPLVDFDCITRGDMNRCLTAWGHKMGPWARPAGFPEWFYALRHHGMPVAVTAAGALIRSRVAGFTREEAVELGRLCAVRPGLNRVALRLWREFVFPALPYRWAVSYQDNAMHTGDLYRFDGWVRLGRSRSGTDPRRIEGRGRDKIIWGWCDDPAERKSREWKPPEQKGQSDANRTDLRYVPPLQDATVAPKMLR